MKAPEEISHIGDPTPLPTGLEDTPAVVDPGLSTQDGVGLEKRFYELADGLNKMRETTAGNGIEVDPDTKEAEPDGAELIFKELVKDLEEGERLDAEEAPMAGSKMPATIESEVLNTKLRKRFD